MKNCKSRKLFVLVLTLLLAAVMLLSLSALGSRTALAAGTETANDEASAAAAMSDVDTQLSLFVSKMDEMKQNDQKSTWYYTVTDLDHDGNLEFVAASLHPAGSVQASFGYLACPRAPPLFLII